MAWTRVGNLTGPAGAAGRDGKDAPAPSGWLRCRPTLRDNGSVYIGDRSTFDAIYRVDRGWCDFHFAITFGARPKSTGGDLRLVNLPVPLLNLDVKDWYGTGTYWNKTAGLWFALTPLLRGNEITFPVSEHGQSTPLYRMRIWDGINGIGTGFPRNPGFFIDAEGSYLRAQIRYPVA